MSPRYRHRYFEVVIQAPDESSKEPENVKRKAIRDVRRHVKQRTGSHGRVTMVDNAAGTRTLLYQCHEDSGKVIADEL